MKLFFLLALLFSLSTYADDISEYRYYDNNGSYMAFIKKSDNCIHGGSVKKNILKIYCEMGSSGLDLKKDYPSVYATELLLSAGTLSFYIAAPWGEQKCKINLHKNTIFCESTGK